MGKINLKINYEDSIHFPTELNRERFVDSGRIVGEFLDLLEIKGFKLVKADIELEDTEMNGIDE